MQNDHTGTDFFFRHAISRLYYPSCELLQKFRKFFWFEIVPQHTAEKMAQAGCEPRHSPGNLLPHPALSPISSRSKVPWTSFPPYALSIIYFQKTRRSLSFHFPPFHNSSIFTLSTKLTFPGACRHMWSLLVVRKMISNTVHHNARIHGKEAISIGNWTRNWEMRIADCGLRTRG